jgi:8-oxo-dGTP pyrophosphatase MutT (NUDIX family)
MANSNPRASSRTVRPRDAASLVLWRKSNGRFEVLMGRRPAKDRFMPDVFVFPGGRVDPEDSESEVLMPLRPLEVERLAGSAGSGDSKRLAVAAIRETYEETGLMIGEGAAGLIRPNLHCLEYLARAITPVESPIRYNARFFMAEAAHANGVVRSNGELLDLDWFSLEQAQALPAVSVTHFVLEEARRRVEGEPFRGIPLIYYRKHVMQLRYRGV